MDFIYSLLGDPKADAETNADAYDREDEYAWGRKSRCRFLALEEEKIFIQAGRHHWQIKKTHISRKLAGLRHRNHDKIVDLQ